MDENKSSKKPRTRLVDYTRTNKKPHSFRYKRGSEFVARERTEEEITAGGPVPNVVEEQDGTIVIGPTPLDVKTTPAAWGLNGRKLKLVAVRKRPNGRSAVTFESDDGKTVISYDSRAARAALRSA